MTVTAIASFTATELNKGGGRILDQAVRGPVAIRRRETEFVLMRRDELDRLLASRGETRPQTLAELLHGYDAEAIKQATRPFLDEEPVGRELI